jgi:hypothetical protein
MVERYRAARSVHRYAILIAASLGILLPAGASAELCEPTASQKSKHVVAFADQPLDWQTDILDLKFGAGERRLPPVPPAPSLGGDAKARYLFPNHPGTQPTPPDAAWCQYTGVDVPPGRRVPIQAPSSEPAAAPGGSGGRPADTTRPRVVAPATIGTTFVLTPEGIFPAVDNEAQQPPGTNLLPTIEHDMYDANGKEMPNTLPSTTTRPYNLHDGAPVVTVINPTSPADDLKYVLDTVFGILTGKSYKSLAEARDNPLPALEHEAAAADPGASGAGNNRRLLEHLLAMAVDIIEGNDGPTSRVPGDRAYRGFALLHHSGQNRVGCVEPRFDLEGKAVVGGNLDVHQIWYGGRIESNTMFVDFGWGGETSRCGRPGVPPIPPDAPWTVNYTIDVLDRGGDDFAPAAIYVNAPPVPVLPSSTSGAAQPAQIVAGAPTDSAPVTSYGGAMPAQTAAGIPAPALPPHVGMDQSFFPMQDGTRTMLKIKMAPAKYYFSTYSWGWRAHPPRAQAMENAHFTLPNGVNVVAAERDVFGSGDPIGKIGDLAPSKRMWRACKSALRAINSGADPDDARCLKAVIDARDAYQDWLDRNHLPSGLEPDPESDLTLLFVDNTIYGQLREGGWIQLPQWTKRGDVLKVTLINGDYFEHGYLNVDFGGNRGWENQFKPTLKLGGSGPFFTFGRFHWGFNTVPGTIIVPPAQGFTADGQPVAPGDMPATVTPGVHRVVMQMDAEPSRRLRMYQFDPLHHDVAIYSMH